MPCICNDSQRKVVAPECLHTSSEQLQQQGLRSLNFLYTPKEAEVNNKKQLSYERTGQFFAQHKPKIFYFQALRWIYVVMKFYAGVANPGVM
jgi:hypothetical protein